ATARAGGAGAVGGVGRRGRSITGGWPPYFWGARGARSWRGRGRGACRWAGAPPSRAIPTLRRWPPTPCGARRRSLRLYATREIGLDLRRRPSLKLWATLLAARRV